MSKPETMKPYLGGQSLTPGKYLRQRRLAARQTIAACVREIARPDHRRFARHQLRALERDQPGDYGPLVLQLSQRRLFPFDLATFALLAAATSDASIDEWAQI